MIRIGRTTEDVGSWLCTLHVEDVERHAHFYVNVAMEVGMSTSIVGVKMVDAIYIYRDGSANREKKD